MTERRKFYKLYLKKEKKKKKDLSETVEAVIIAVPQLPSKDVLPWCQQGEFFESATNLNSGRAVNLKLVMINDSLIPLLPEIIVHVKVLQHLSGAVLKYSHT